MLLCLLLRLLLLPLLPVLLLLLLMRRHQHVKILEVHVHAALQVPSDELLAGAVTAQQQVTEEGRGGASLRGRHQRELSTPVREVMAVPCLLRVMHSCMAWFGCT